jgi:hypothetical protein
MATNYNGVLTYAFQVNLTRVLIVSALRDQTQR